MVRAARATTATETTGPTGPAGRGGRASARPGPSRAPGGAGSDDGGRPGPRLSRRRTLLLVAVLAVLLGGFGTWALYGSPWLRLEHVSVSGTRVLGEREVLRAAAVPTGAPLVTIDTAAAERRVRAALPRVRDVEAVRSWPHGIGLKVTERRPELVMENAGEYVEVDSEGVRFATVGKPPRKVPLLVLDREHGRGFRYFGTARLRREAASVAAALPQSVHRATRVIRVRSYDDITLELSGDRTVRWGSAERGAAKAKSLTAVMKAAKGADRFDVSVPGAPAASDS